MIVHTLESVREGPLAESELRSEEWLKAKIGRGNVRLADHRGLRLSRMAAILAEKHDIARGASLGLYCCMDVEPRDLGVEKIFSGAGSLEEAMESFRASIPPGRFLRSLPASQAFWAAVSVGAEGVVRVFAECASVESQAVHQAEIDLRLGLCEVAIVVGVKVSPDEAWGKLIVLRNE